MKKKFLSILLCVVVFFSISAQEKLRDFLDGITEITNQEMSVQSEFDLVYQSAINSLNTDTQIEMSNISNYELTWSRSRMPPQMTAPPRLVLFLTWVDRLPPKKVP